MNTFSKTDCEGFYRRDFLKIGAAGLFGLSLPQLLQLEARAASKSEEPHKSKAKAVIMVWLGGGPATIDMWDLKPDAPKEIGGEFNSFNTQTEAYEISERLPKM